MNLAIDQKFVKDICVSGVFRVPDIENAKNLVQAVTNKFLSEHPDYTLEQVQSEIAYAIIGSFYVDDDKNLTIADNEGNVVDVVCSYMSDEFVEKFTIGSMKPTIVTIFSAEDNNWTENDLLITIINQVNGIAILTINIHEYMNYKPNENDPSIADNIGTIDIEHAINSIAIFHDIENDEYHSRPGSSLYCMRY